MSQINELNVSQDSFMDIIRYIGEKLDNLSQKVHDVDKSIGVLQNELSHLKNEQSQLFKKQDEISHEVKKYAEIIAKHDHKLSNLDSIGKMISQNWKTIGIILIVLSSGGFAMKAMDKHLDALREIQIEQVSTQHST
jgi:chromosome segregation ATPase